MEWIEVASSPYSHFKVKELESMDNDWSVIAEDERKGIISGRYTCEQPLGLLKYVDQGTKGVHFT